MHIFIDESGGFIPLAGARSRASCVGALVVPTNARRALFAAFRHLKGSFRLGGAEPKGSALNEDQIAAVLDLLARHDCLLEVCACDLGEHTEADVALFQASQADALLNSVGREHKRSLVHDVALMADKVRGLSRQLFVQVFLTILLVERTLETATMYYAQRMPPELGKFVWRVDAKDKARTIAEEIWTTLLLPILQTASEDRPMGLIPGGDYRYFQRFRTMRNDVTPARRAVDLKKVIRNDFQFLPSHDEPGLQLADIAASAVSRGLNGTLQDHGWLPAGRLFVRRSEQTVRLVALRSAVPPGNRMSMHNPRFADVIGRFEAGAKSMIRDAAAVRHAAEQMGLG